MAKATEKFCLKWNDFQENLTRSFRELRTDLDFTDVTLVCDGDQEVEAHKFILKSGSPFFSKVLTRHKHAHPIIYMRGIMGKDMEAILDFIYYGEANIYQEDLNDFLALAEDLQLKGLSGTQTDNRRTIREPKVLTQNNEKPENEYENIPEYSKVISDSFSEVHKKNELYYNFI